MNRRDFLILGSGLCLASLAPRAVLAAFTAIGEKSMRYKHWETLCVGRYLVDAPAEALVSFNPIFGDGTLRKTQGTPLDAKKMAEDKVQELKATPHETKGTSYIQSIPLANGGVLVQGWEFNFSTESTKAFLYIPVTTHHGPVIYLYTKRILDILEQQTLRELIAFGSSFKSFPQGSIPKESGFCFDDVMVLNVPESIKERCSVGINDPRVKGLIFSFETSLIQYGFSWLTKIERRTEENCRSIQEEGKCERLRFGKHNVGSIQGEEICLAGKTYDGRYRTYLFEWDNPGIKEDKNSPNLRATVLYKGIPLQHPSAPIPFSTDAEALDVWDKFVGTIRIRPVG